MISKLIPDEMLEEMKRTGENPHWRCSGQTLGWALSAIGLAMTQPQELFYLKMEEHHRHHRDHGAHVIREIIEHLEIKHLKLKRDGGAWSLYYDIWRK